MAESVELATILLTDLVGSTRLANSVGPVRADELREEHFGLLRDAVAAYEGKEVKNTGDGLMVAFSSASAAIGCAVAMQQRFERRYRDAEQGLHIRIGLGAGESTVKDGDYFGMPSIEAARLCGQAPSEGILVSGLAKTLAGRCEGVEFSSAGELELKGFENPVEAFSVSWAPLAEETGGPSRWPLPALLRAVPPVAYVGRIDERAAVERAIELSRSGKRQVVLLSGEPGIGKTRLASYAAHHAHGEGFAVAWGGCSEELAVPYEPWIELATHLVEYAPSELLRGHVERHGGELSRLVRNLQRRIPDVPAPQTSDPETERYLLLNAVAGLFAQAAKTVPLCVVLDDLHWADAQSLALLKHVLRSAEQGSLQVIGTFRDSELGKDHPLTAILADLRSVEGVQRISLHGLGGDDVAEIMRAVAGHELEADAIELAGRITAETDGNPFFVGEILRGLSESGALVFDEAAQRWSIDSSTGVVLPESVREVIERRLERLGEQSLEALRLAAVMGREFDLHLLSAAVDLDETRLLDLLEAAVAASVLAESAERVGRFRFVHALINQTLYEGLGATRRARLHERVAQALERLYGQDPGEHLGALALHWRLAAVSVDRAKAADYSLKAGRRALESLAPADALTLFADAAELIDAADSPERCEALIGLGEAQRQTGDPAHRETLLEASRIAVALEDPDMAARAALVNSRAGTGSRAFGETDHERIEAIERALELDDPPDPARRARLLALQALELTWEPDFPRRRALADEALALARRAGDRRALAEVIPRAFLGIWCQKTLDSRAALVEELSGLAGELGDPTTDMLTELMRTQVCLERGELAAGQVAVTRWRASADELGEPSQRWFTGFQTAGQELLHGRLDAGLALAEHAFQVGQETGQPDAMMIYGAQLVFVRLYQGRAHEVVEILEQTAAASPGIAALGAALSQILCVVESYDRARSILDAAAEEGFDHLVSSDALATMAIYADAAVRSQHEAAAAKLYDAMAPYSEQVVWVSSQGYGHARLWLGLLAGTLGEHQRADEHLDFACRFHEANDVPLWAARGHLGWAEALAARGDAPAAREHALRALELSREHGYALFEPRAAALVETESAAGT